jgi:hypothetical protein
MAMRHVQDPDRPVAPALVRLAGGIRIDDGLFLAEAKAGTNQSLLGENKFERAAQAAWILYGFDSRRKRPGVNWAAAERKMDCT